MNMVFSGVAGPGVPVLTFALFRGAPFAPARIVSYQMATVNARSRPEWLPYRPMHAHGKAGLYDNASISLSLRSPGTMMTGIGKEPTALAIALMIGPGPSGPDWRRGR